MYGPSIPQLSAPTGTRIRLSNQDSRRGLIRLFSSCRDAVYHQLQESRMQAGGYAPPAPIRRGRPRQDNRRVHAHARGGQGSPRRSLRSAPFPKAMMHTPQNLASASHPGPPVPSPNAICILFAERNRPARAHPDPSSPLKPARCLCVSGSVHRRHQLHCLAADYAITSTSRKHPASIPLAASHVPSLLPSATPHQALWSRLTS